MHIPGVDLKLGLDAFFTLLTKIFFATRNISEKKMNKKALHIVPILYTYFFLLCSYIIFSGIKKSCLFVG